MVTTYDFPEVQATMPPSIRRAASTDAPTIIEFNRLLALESEGKELDRAQLTAGVAQALDDKQKGIYFLAEDDGLIVGQIMITYEWSDWRNGWFWWIQSVYVRKEARRTGVFRALFDHVHREAQNDPAVIGIRLYVEAENHAAQGTYKRSG